MSFSTVRWGILGTARITAKVAPAMQLARGSQIAAIASRSHDKGSAWARQYATAEHPIAVFDSYEALLAADTIDAVYIPLPPSLHHEWTIKAARAGKHVLVEKPLARSAAEGEEMLAACREHNVQLMDGVMWYHHPRRAALVAAAHDKAKLGALRRVTSAFTFCYHELPQQEFRLTREHLGGSLYDLGWYNVGLTLQMYRELPQQVWGTARWHNDVDMNFSGVMWFANDRMSSFDCGFDTGFRNWMEVAGTHGSLVCDDFVQPWDHQRLRYWVHDERGKTEEVHVPGGHQIVLMIEDFCALARSGRCDPQWGQLSIDTQRVCDALDRSARAGQPVTL